MNINRSVDVHQFAMVPRSDIPRARFNMQTAHKTTFDAGYLVPVLCEEVLPGDTFQLKMTAFARLSTPIFPIMDNLHLESFFFFVPNRLVWSNWKKFMGEQDNPADSISFTVPKVIAPAAGFPVNSLYDYLGLQVVGQPVGATGQSVNSLPLRAYNLIWNQWFRDENLQNSVANNVGDTEPVGYLDYNLLKRGKRHDYFTSSLPWPQKGGTSVSIPLGTSATVRVNGTDLVTGAQAVGVKWRETAAGALPAGNLALGTSNVAPGNMAKTATAVATGGAGTELYPSNLYADLSTATAATINQLRQAFQIQKLLERDARGGTRYTEIIRAHFGVVSPDARLQRPEYLGGGHTPIVIHPVAQTSATGLTGGSSPLANLAAIGTAVASRHGFSQSFTEHGYILGLVSVRADLSYQQGVRRHWTRSTRYDYYFPAFAMLGEQAVLNKEIYWTGTPAIDDAVFGYQERWAEYRYIPAAITGKFRSYVAGTLDAWHLAQRFTSLPALNATFIEENPPLQRILAVGAGAGGAQIIFDSFFEIQAARPMPLYSVPGLLDHF